MTKTDLAGADEFDWGAALSNIQAVRPGMRVFKVSAKTGEGMGDYLEFFAAERAQVRTAAAV